jgi:hypothetical protein
MWRWTF